ncbi:MAG TPA: carbamoyltransferase C-terminal domain-containing protein [Candidatus Norongarragalinales archaeon]|jgi:carbamoyltransferase|nr:carbamoyltransferase C-terminal domain-containing protein [Candidatus Norongarragalinales archaeon]
MLYLGLSGGTPGAHDPAAALIEDGKILSVMEEERLSLVKHGGGAFPTLAAKWCLKQAGVKITDVDKVCYYMRPDIIEALKRGSVFKPQSWIGAIGFYRRADSVVGQNLKHYFRANPKVHYVEHHVAHAASSFYISGFEKANILSMDGAGERATTLLAVGDGKKIEKIKEIYLPNSMGILYSTFTDFLGFKPDCDEGKVMGLAPYGKPTWDFFKLGIVTLTPDGYKVDPTWFGGDGSLYSEKVVKTFGEPRLGGTTDERHANVAASMQDCLEKTAIHLARILYNKTGLRDLCITGGVGFNCKMNGVLLQQDFIDNVFVPPTAGDAGGAIGSAVYESEMDGHGFSKLKHAYYGSAYDEAAIEKELKLAKVKYERVSDVPGTAADLVAKGRIVGWFQGRMEMGARALGARSILANPAHADMKDKINHYVKHREPFRPFCPSMTVDAGQKYLNSNGKPKDAPYMIVAYDIVEERRDDIPAVVHVDGTARPQTVERDVNPLYYDYLKALGKVNNGVEVSLNTSFNDMGQPIVERPDQAVKMFYGCGMDDLVIGPFLLTKK